MQPYTFVFTFSRVTTVCSIREFCYLRGSVYMIPTAELSNLYQSYCVLLESFVILRGLASVNSPAWAIRDVIYYYAIGTHNCALYHLCYKHILISSSRAVTMFVCLSMFFFLSSSSGSELTADVSRAVLPVNDISLTPSPSSPFFPCPLKCNS